MKDTSGTSEITVRSASCVHFTIEPQPGFTVEQILDMLNRGQVRLAPGDREIVQRFEPPMDAMIVLARVRAQRRVSASETWEAAAPAGGEPA